MKFRLPFYVMTVISVICIVVIVVLLSENSGSNSDAVASVNGEEITKDEMYEELYNQQTQAGNIGDQLLEQKIVEMVINQKANELNIELADSEVDEAIQYEKANLIKSYGSEDYLNMLLAQSGMTMADLEEDMRRGLPLQLLAKHILNDQVAVTAEAIEEHYESNQELYTEPEMVEASHILVETQEEADDILAQLDGGADFAELAKEHSIDPVSGANGGELGFFAHERMVPEFSDAAFALEVGDISDVVESQHGFHIILVTDRTAERVIPLEEVQAEIEYELTSNNLQQVYSGWLEELRAESDISYN